MGRKRQRNYFTESIEDTEIEGGNESVSLVPSNNEETILNNRHKLHIWDVDSNPHLMQCTGCSLIYHDDPPQRILNESAPKLKYRRRHGEVKSTVHWGQRKLIISEIEFLTKFVNSTDIYTCIYAGAAPGIHIPYLSELFPMVTFILIDPSDFKINTSDRIIIRKEYMTNDIANEYSGLNNVFLISDVRSVDYRFVTSSQVEDDIKRDMNWQMDWHKIIKPLAGMYKFRLPWDDKCSEYLDGDIYLPVWGPQSTTECRLIVSNHGDTNHTPMRVYNHQTICDQLFYFNTVTRCSVYNHDVKHPEMDYCYDCASEIFILRDYLLKTSKSFSYTSSKLNSKISILSTKISKACSIGKRPRSLLQTRSISRFQIRDFDFSNKIVNIISPPNQSDSNSSENSSIVMALEIISEAIRSSKLLKQGKDSLRWIDIQEFAWDDVDDSLVSLGVFGGCSVPHGSAADIWLWNIASELDNNVAFTPDDVLDQCESNSKSFSDRLLLNFVDNVHRCQVFKSLTSTCKVLETEGKSFIALMMLTSSGCAYFYTNMNNADDCLAITKICLPSIDYSHDKSLFLVCLDFDVGPLSNSSSGMNYGDSFYSSKTLVVADVLMWKGQSVAEKSCTFRQSLLKQFLQVDFNFSERLELLQLSPFKEIRLI